MIILSPHRTMSALFGLLPSPIPLIMPVAQCVYSQFNDMINDWVCEPVHLDGVQSVRQCLDLEVVYRAQRELFVWAYSSENKPNRGGWRKGYSRLQQKLSLPILI